MMAFCKYCGEHVNDYAAFCKNCGQRVNLCTRAQVGTEDFDTNKGIVVDGNYGQIITVYDDNCFIEVAEGTTNYIDILERNFSGEIPTTKQMFRKDSVIRKKIENSLCENRKIFFSKCSNIYEMNVGKRLNGILRISDQTFGDTFFFFDGKVPIIRDKVAYLYYNVLARAIIPSQSDYEYKDFDGELHSKKNDNIRDGGMSKKADEIEEIPRIVFPKGFTQSEYEMLAKLKELRDSGAITTHEYERKKRKILKV